MVEVLIKLNTSSDVNSFVHLASMCEKDVNVYSGRYIVDGKSLMAIFSLDLTKPIKVEFNGEIPKEVREEMKKFIVN